MRQGTPIPIRVFAADGSARTLGSAPARPAKADSARWEREQEPEAADQGERPTAEPHELEQENTLLRSKLKELHGDLARLQRRFDEDVAAAKLEGQEIAVRAVQPAFTALTQATELMHDRDPELCAGLDFVSDALGRAIEAAGFTRVEDEGADFDPAIHEAVAVEPAGSARPGEVLRVLAPGFARRDDSRRVVVAARVVVASNEDRE